jgi:hypothetical protein
MIRSGRVVRALVLFPWLVAGRLPASGGFSARRQFKRTGIFEGTREMRRGMSARLRQGLALARDWIAPGDAIAQWTHFVTSVCNARCAHCFYPINAGKTSSRWTRLTS